MDSINETSNLNTGGDRWDPVLTAVLANRLDSIVREMTNTLMRSARSSLICVARDFSCSIVTSSNELISAAEGLPVHIFGSHTQCQSMTDLHPDLAEGDAYLHNDPYLGNSHAADHTVLVPVFFEGEHLFTAVAKAHQADIGNSKPTTLTAEARDVYEEGALIFPCVRLQRDYQMNEDLLRMCRKRIRTPGLWYGDLLAAVGAGRIAEKRLKELCVKYGKDAIKRFCAHWLNYSEERMAQAIRALPKATISSSSTHDPISGILPEGMTVGVKIHIDPDAARISIDLRDNPDNIECGLNLSSSSSINCAVLGVFNCIDHDIPHNSGAFRRIDVQLREGCAVGIPRFPHSCSLATTNLAMRLGAASGSAFAELGDGMGIAEGGMQIGAAYGTISGTDFRRDSEPFSVMLELGNDGGPANAVADGWVTYGCVVIAGLMYRDSVEIDELKYPIHIERMHLVPGSGGAGRFRGAPGLEIVYGPRKDPLTVIIPADGQQNPPKGVLGGQAGAPGETFKVDIDGHEERLPAIVELVLRPGEFVRGVDNGGGGYGDPMERDPQRVLADVIERYETLDRAHDIYGVALVHSGRDLSIDWEATQVLRRQPAL